MQNWCINQNTYVMSPIWFEWQHRREKKRKLHDLKCSPGSDIESQNLIINVVNAIKRSQRDALRIKNACFNWLKSPDTDVLFQKVSDFAQS